MISVLIIAKNSEDLIKSCLESVKWADEIVVVDNDSTDKTSDIAKRYTDKVFKKSAHDFSEIRNYGLSKCNGDFVLCVDTDERVLKDLKDEIIKIIVDDTQNNAWEISRINIILGEEKKYPAFWPDLVIRLFRKDQLKGWEGAVHEQPKFNGSLGRLKNSFLHLTHRDIDSMVLKSLDWANIDAKLRFEAHHPKMTGVRFFRILITETFNQGIIRRGFFNGTVGVIDSLLQVFSFYISYVKLWQMQQKPSLEEKYKAIDDKLIKEGFEYKK